jgi:predicted transcriptional regulator
MTKSEAIAQIEATLPVLTTEQAQALAALAEAWTRDPPPEDAETLAAIAEGKAQADRGEFATEAEVAAAFARFRTK